MMRVESYLGLGQLSANMGNMDTICVDLMAKVQNETEICGKPYVNGSNIVLNCMATRKHQRAKMNAANNTHRGNHSSRSPTAVLTALAPAPTAASTGVPYANKPYTASGLVAVLDICVATCMDDPGQTCCMVPSAIMNFFRFDLASVFRTRDRSHVYYREMTTTRLKNAATTAARCLLWGTCRNQYPTARQLR